ncbi:MAG: OmpH family outer membrane protein [Bacteroidaceae bacterium]|nr:OmpH family outer membrane protein [Bacteroidaceae bacterium]
MKKVVLALMLACAYAFSANAQKYALIDMEYILENIPEYKAANTQIETKAKAWQSEVETMMKQVQDMYKDYQNAKNLSAQAQNQKEEAILKKEKEVQDLRQKYFGQDGELMKMRELLIKPIQDNIYEAVKAISLEQDYKMVIDRASDQAIIFASPDIDISDDVLQRLGYSK